MLCVVVFVFCKQKTAYEMRISDWSSDVCSSDLEEARPVIWVDGVQRLRDILELIGHLAPVALAAAEEGAREIVEALLAPRRGADQHVGVEPDERAFAVIILAPRPAREGFGPARGDDRVERRVVDRAPAAPRLAAVPGRDGRPLRERPIGRAQV